MSLDKRVDVLEGRADKSEDRFKLIAKGLKGLKGMMLNSEKNEKIKWGYRVLVIVLLIFISMFSSGILFSMFLGVI